MASHTDGTPGPSTDCLTDEQNRNTAKIHCQYCPSIILLPGKGELVTDMSVDIPQMHRKKSASQGEQFPADVITRFWRVEDQFTFENAGFTFSVDGVRYITCADCEMGPIGFVDKETRVHYVAVPRVKHQPAQ